MKFEYPVKEITDENASGRTGSSNSFGYYPISRFNAWHGGFHIEGAGKEIRAISDGKVIAYRFPTDYTEETIGTEKSLYSNGFVLIRHEYKSPKGQELTFFSLYMHLLPKKYMDGSKRRTPVIFTGKTADVNGINARRGVDKSVAFVIPKGAIVDLDPAPVPAGHWSLSADALPSKFRKVTYKDSNITTWTEIFIATTYKFVEEAGGGKLKIKADKATGPCAECYSFNIKGDKFNKVINCSIPVKAGDLIGYTGQYGFEKQPNYTAAHVEVFTHEDVTAFLKDAKNDGEKEKNYFKVKKGAVLKKAYPGKIPGGGKIKILQEDGSFTNIQAVSAVKTVAHADLTWHAPAETETNGHYTIKTGDAFNRVNLAFGNLLAKDAKLEKLEITGDLRKVSHSFPAAVKNFWINTASLPAGTEAVRDLASDLDTVYEQKPDPARLEDKAEHEAVVAKKSCRKVTGTDGKTWYYIRLEDEHKEGWISEDNASLVAISAYNWTDFGFTLVRDLEDQYLYDPEKPPAFLNDVWKSIDTDDNKVLSSRELRNAFNNPITARKLSRLVCQHTSEWDWNDKWSGYKTKILKLYQEGIDEEQDGALKKKLEARRDQTLNALEARLKALCFWKEVSPVPEEEKKEEESFWSFTSFSDVIDRMFGDEPKVVTPPPPKPPAPVLFPPSSKVYHFHPVAFVEQMRRLGKRPFIDWVFISKQEGGSQLKGYVPHNKVDGIKVAIGKSGVTIAAGFDIGQHGETELKAIFKDSPTLLNLYLPYSGKKKAEAIDYLEDNPLQISKEQAEETNRLIHESQKKGVIKHYNSLSPLEKFEDLPTGVQTAVMSISFQYGPSSSFLKEMWQALKVSNFDEVYDFFDDKSEEGKPYYKRRREEKNYLKKHLND